MIKDTLANANIYYNISENLKKGFEWLKKQDVKNIKIGKHIIDENGMYANVENYTTKTDAKYEAHKKYIDIQYMIKGEEYVGVTNITNCCVCEEYDPQRDIEFLDCNHSDEFVTLHEGNFLVLFPNDAHKPSISLGMQISVKKVVIKVPLD